MNLETITHQAKAYGLTLRGGFNVTAEDDVPLLESGQVSQSLVLLGNAGSSLWPEFSKSAEIQDGLDHPLDRWSQRIGDELAATLGGVAFYPFGGPPYQPFIRWAKKAESLRSSKLGMLIHPEYGLWHAYRMALALPEQLFDQHATRDTTAGQQRHACDTCMDKPCYGVCPVEAFANDQYDVDRCVRYLDANPDAPCNHNGCIARMNCPEGESFRYLQPHAEFHIAQFVKNRMKYLND